MMISPISSHLSLSRPQLYHHLGTWSVVIPLYRSIPRSSVNTEYIIHQAQHTLSTAYTEYSILRVLNHPMIDCLPLLASLSSLIDRWTLLYSTRYFPTILSLTDDESLSFRPRHSPDIPPPDRPPPSVSPNSLGHGLQVNRQTHSITSSQWTSKHARLWPLSSALSSFDLGLQMYIHTRMIMASQFE
jgi:hypothetical protein